MLLVLVAGLMLQERVVGAQTVGSRQMEAFQGEAFGTGYSVAVSDGPGSFRFAGRSRCVDLELSTDDGGAPGCASASGRSGGLAGYGLVCAGSGRFLSGLIPETRVALRGTTAAGGVVAGQVRALPAGWIVKGNVWLIALPRTEALTSVEALNRSGTVIFRYRFTPHELRCSSPVAAVGGRVHKNVSWTFKVTKTRGAGRVNDSCTALDISMPTGGLTAGNGSLSCGPVSLTGRALLLGTDGEHSCSPSYAIFSGLVARRVTRVEVILKGGRRLQARLVRIAPSARLPFNAFVSANARNGDEIAFVVHTRSGQSQRFALSQGASPSPC